MPRAVSVYDQAILERRLWTPGLTPTEVWYDCSDRSTLTWGASAVSVVADKLGRGRDLAQANNASAQPTIAESGIAGLPALNFDGTNDTMSAVSWGTITFPFTYCYVFRITTLAINSVLVSNRANANLLEWIDASSRLNQYAATAYVNPQQLASNTDYLRVAHYNSASSYTSMQGTTSGLFNPGSASAAGLRLGAWTSDGVNFTSFSRFRLGEFIMLSGSLSDNLRQTVEGYLAHKWKLAHRLPGTHPFRNVPPMR